MNRIVRTAVALFILSLVAIVVVNVVSAEGGIEKPARQFNACGFRWVDPPETATGLGTDDGCLHDCSFCEKAVAATDTGVCSPLDGQGYIGSAQRIQTRAQVSVLDVCSPLDGEGFSGPEYRGGSEVASTSSCNTCWSCWDMDY